MPTKHPHKPNTAKSFHCVGQTFSFYSINITFRKNARISLASSLQIGFVKVNVKQLLDRKNLSASSFTEKSLVGAATLHVYSTAAFKYSFDAYPFISTVCLLHLAIAHFKDKDLTHSWHKSLDTDTIISNKQLKNQLLKTFIAF